MVDLSMQHWRSRFPAPRSRTVAWLLAPVRSIGPDGDAELRQSLARRLESVLASALVTFSIAAIAACRHPTVALLCWIGLDIAVATVRIPLIVHILRRTRGMPNGAGIDPWAVDLFVGLGTMWSALLGFGTLACLATGDPGLSVLVALLAMGTVGAQASRAPGVPRLNIVQMCLIVVPLAIGAAVSTIPVVPVAVVLAPLYLAGMINITRELHKDYVTIFMTRLDNRRRALHCALTDLPNRSSFNEHLARALAEAEANKTPLALMYLDLDGFKGVNDGHGHSAGDLLLRQVGDRLRREVAPGTMVARLGGDEFAILMESGDVAAVTQTAQSIIAALGRPFPLSPDCTVGIGVSIGIAEGGTATESRGSVVDRADAALYAAKRAGKGVVRWYDSDTAVAPSSRSGPAKALRDIAAEMRAREARGSAATG